MANTQTQKTTTRPRRTERQMLEATVAKQSAIVENLSERLNAAKAKAKDAQKRLDALTAAEKANAEEQIAFHEAELERLRSLVTAE